jgi:hypothetical protein
MITISTNVLRVRLPLLYPRIIDDSLIKVANASQKRPTIGGAGMSVYGVHHSDSANSIHLFLRMEFNIHLIIKEQRHG